MGRQSKAESASVQRMEDAVRQKIIGNSAHHAEVSFIDRLVDVNGAVAVIKVRGYSKVIYATVCPWGESAEIHVPREARDGLVVP